MTFRTTRIASIGVGAALLAAAFAGCGGSDDDSGALSKDEFIAQADQICADANAEADAKEPEFVAAIENNDLDAAADLIVETSQLITDGVADIEALEAPEEDQETIDEFLALSEEQVALADDLAEAIRNDDGVLLEELSAEGDALEVESDAIADEYGFVDCGSASDDNDSSAG